MAFDDVSQHEKFNSVFMFYLIYMNIFVSVTPPLFVTLKMEFFFEKHLNSKIQCSLSVALQRILDFN